MLLPSQSHFPAWGGDVRRGVARREYPCESATFVSIPLWVRVHGDVLVRVLHHSRGHLGGTIQVRDPFVFRFGFHTGR